MTMYEYCCARMGYRQARIQRGRKALVGDIAGAALEHWKNTIRAKRFRL
jgi:hypothetical protein